MRELLARVTIRDCQVQTFRVGGKGGQRRDKRDTGVRIVHEPSGAVGESRQHRTQGQNKKAAFLRMAKSEKFTRWARLLGYELPESDVLVEIRKNGVWTRA